MGSYPDDSHDFDLIQKNDVTAVLDIQTSYDHLVRQIDANRQKKQLEQRGIKVYKHVEVSDLAESDYCHNLFEAAKILNDLINNQGHKVFLNCTAGVSRSPTLVIVYIALFIQHESWDDIEQVYEFVESEYPWQDSNVKVAQIIIENKQEFQQHNLRVKLEKEAR